MGNSSPQNLSNNNPLLLPQTQPTPFTFPKQLLSIFLMLSNTSLNCLLMWQIYILFPQQQQEEIMISWLTRCFIIIISSIGQLLCFFIVIWAFVNACQMRSANSRQYRVAALCGIVFPYLRYYVARLKNAGDVPSFRGERVYATIVLGIGMISFIGWLKIPEKENPEHFLYITIISLINSLVIWPIFYYLYKDWQELRRPTDII